MDNLSIVLDPVQRKDHIARLLSLDGLSHVEENVDMAYCPISLTSTPDSLKPLLRKRQEVLKDILFEAGISVYDPADSKQHNPDFNRSALPHEVYCWDSQKVLSARFFAGHLLLPSTGQGNEAEKARQFNRISVMLVDKNIRVSRMQPYRAIYLQYGNLEGQRHDFVEVFRLLRQFDPGMGFNGDIPVLLGFHKLSGEVVDLEEFVYKRFPHLQYMYNGEVPILRLRAENPGLFYEHSE